MTARISAVSLFFLVFLTVLGHACDLPIGMTAAAHAHADAQEPSDHHPDDSQLACDAVVGVRPNPSASCSIALDLHSDLQPIVRAIAWNVVAQRADVSLGHRRPPLFLLHAALLI